MTSKTQPKRTAKRRARDELIAQHKNRIAELMQQLQRATPAEPPGPAFRAPRAEAPMLAVIRDRDTVALTALLAERQETESRDSRGCTPLIVSLQTGYLEGAELLLRHGARPDAVQEVDALMVGAGLAANPLTVAIAHDQRDLVRLVLSKLVERGAPIVDGAGDPAGPLHLAAEKGHDEVVCTLLAAGLDVNASTRAGRTALMAAGIHNRPKVIQRLVAAGADVDARDLQGRTALLLASMGAKTRAIEALLRAGADRALEDESGVTPLGALRTIARSTDPRVKERAQKALGLLKGNPTRRA